MIEVHNLTKKYGSKSIISDWKYTFRIGKTTILKSISGLIQADTISLYTEAGNVSNKDYLSRDIYYVSDEPVYYNDLTLQEHLWLICKVENYSREEATEKIKALVNHFNMSEYMNYYPSAMSKGTLQRMMLIISFLKKTKNLLLDEPFNGLDPVQLSQVLKNCEKEKSDRCIIISSHDIESLEEICDEFLIFKNGEIMSFTDGIDRMMVNKMIGDSYV